MKARTSSFTSVFPALVAIVVLFTAPVGMTAEETPPTPFEKECQGIALLLEREVNAREGGFVERYFDVNACVERALAGIDAPKRVVEDFRRSAPEGYFKAFSKSLLEASSLRVLRLHGTAREGRALMRLVPRQGGVDYLDLVFVSTRRGTMVVDAELFAQGQSLSSGLRAQFLPLSKDAARGFRDELSRANREWVEQLPQIRQLETLNRSGRYGEVLAGYAKLPASVQKSKLALMQQMTACAQVDARGLNSALDVWRATYPSDVSLELITANLYYAKRRYDLASAALDRLGPQLGGDAYLDVVRAQWQKNQGNIEQARPFARKAVTRNPKLHEGWEMLISLALATRNYADVALTLNEWEKATQVDVLRMAESDKLLDFARSTEGRQWIAGRDSHPTSTPAPAGAAKAPASASAAAPAPAPGSARTPPRLQGIFYSASKPSAIIGGRTVYAGDRLTSGYRVERITPRSVTLQSPEGESVELALK